MLAVGKLAGGIAHDFNNLLTAIIGFCDLLLMRHQPGDPSFADMMQIKQNANRAANLVRQLLAFSRQQTLQPQTICLPDIVADLSNLLNRLLGAGISLDVNHGNDVCPVRVDRIQLEQVLINLAVNGRDAMQGNGVLSIRCQNAAQDDPRLVHGTPPLPPGEWVFIRVADTGQGILPEHLDQIFEPFFTTKPVGEGTGLGLSTVFGIVKQTGGYIYAENLKNGGAAFSIYLPADTESEVLSTPKQPRADLTGNATILLVEDEDPVRMFCARALRSKGYRVTEARNGQAAISLIENNVDPFDLMITDVVMPEMDGPTLIEMSRAIRPDLPIICISGYADGSFRDRINQFGNLLFLGKPFTLQQLAKVVKDATSSKFSNL
jgi:two-component system cell cycle sensor histidine kinase/response regulator CckA